MTRTAMTLSALLVSATALSVYAQPLQVRPLAPNLQNQTDPLGMLQNQVEGLKARVAAQDQEIASLKAAVEAMLQRQEQQEAAFKGHSHRFVYNTVYAKNSTGNSIVKTPAYTDGPIEVK
jgi:hypothetical protein